MSKRSIAVAALLAAFAGTASAGAYDGVYKPALPFAATWSAEQALASGNGLKVAGETLSVMGAECRLSKPVPIRAMQATLFDSRCGKQAAHRVMLMKTAAGLLVIQDGSAVEWLLSQ